MSAVQQPHPASDRAAARLAGGSPVNLPNVITVARLILAVVMFALIDAQVWLAACAVFLVAASTDFVDGYIARRYGLVTVVGRILDPFVDKVIIGGAFIFLAARPGSHVHPWVAVIVIGREMFITSLRSFLESEGKDFSAVLSGKIKMVVQCAAVALVLINLAYGVGSAWEHELRLATRAVVWLTVAVTVYSGYAYVVRAIGMFRESRS